MKKGSPEGYNAETGLLQPAQKPQTGEPHELEDIEARVSELERAAEASKQHR